MNRRHTDRKVNWYRVAVILGLGLLLAYLAVLLGSIKGSWIIPSASAAESTITWIPPTTNCNGSVLTNLSGYDLTYGKARVPLPLTPLSKTVTGLTPGTWWFSLAALTADGERSEFITVEDVIEPAEFVTTAPTAYTLIKRTDRLVLAPVGTVPVGTICDATQSVNGYYAVPRTQVTWSGTVKPDVVVAKCD